MTKHSTQFAKLRTILERHTKGLEGRDEHIGSTAKQKKDAYHLYGMNHVSVLEREPQQTYIVGIIQQKSYVGLYFMPIYSHPEKFATIPDGLRKLLKGKSCFHIKENTAPETLSDIEKLIKKGIALYGEEGWL